MQAHCAHHNIHDHSFCGSLRSFIGVKDVEISLGVCEHSEPHSFWLRCQKNAAILFVTRQAVPHGEQLQAGLQSEIATQVSAVEQPEQYVEARAVLVLQRRALLSVFLRALQGAGRGATGTSGGAARPARCKSRPTGRRKHLG